MFAWNGEGHVADKEVAEGTVVKMRNRAPDVLVPDGAQRGGQELHKLEEHQMWSHSTVHSAAGTQQE